MPAESRTLDLSIVIPSFNEAKRLPESLGSILRYLEQRRGEHEVLVVDDGSEDGTSIVAAAFEGHDVRVLRLQKNRGKGAACRAGVAASRGRLVLLTDADLSTPIEDLGNLKACLGEAEVVLGSRAVTGANITRRQSIYRMLLGKTFNKLIQLGGLRGISDTQCGFKLLKGEVARRLFSDLVTDGFAFDVELVWLARRRGYRVVEVGVTWANSRPSAVSLITDPPRMILDILRFRWLQRREPDRRV